MPIYDFQCNDCGHKDEVMRRISAPSKEACPQCGKDTFAKQLSAPSFQLSGTGWYATDFKDKKPAIKNDSADKKSASDVDATSSKVSSGSSNKPSKVVKKDNAQTGKTELS